MTEKKYTVSKAAKLCELTAEALRHYDRTGLVPPHGRDKYTEYRYYTDDDLVALRTVALLRRMDISLPDIAALLQENNLNGVIKRLQDAQTQASIKIKQLETGISQIRHACAVYEKLSETQPPEREGVYAQTLPERKIFVSSVPDFPHAGNLWDYRAYFYREIAEKDREKFSFGETAAVLFEQDSRMFIECENYAEGYPQVRSLPRGKYFCLQCAPENIERAKEVLRRSCAEAGAAIPAWYVAQLRITGLLKWDYLLKMYAEN